MISFKTTMYPPFIFVKLEDLKVLRRSPDLLNNVKIGQGQLQLIMEQILFYHICCRHIVLTIYGRCGHLGHVTKIFCINFG